MDQRSIKHVCIDKGELVENIPSARSYVKPFRGCSPCYIGYAPIASQDVIVKALVLYPTHHNFLVWQQFTKKFQVYLLSDVI